MKSDIQKRIILLPFKVGHFKGLENKLEGAPLPARAIFAVL